MRILLGEFSQQQQRSIPRNLGSFFENTEQERRDSHDRENDEQNLGNTCRAGSDTPKAKQCRNKGYHKKYDCVMQHGRLLRVGDVCLCFTTTRLAVVMRFKQCEVRLFLPLGSNHETLRRRHVGNARVPT